MPRRAFLSKVGDAKLAALQFNLKAARVERKLTQHQAAELLFVSQPTIVAWEKNGGMPAVYREYWLMYWEKHTKQRSKRTLKKTKEIAARIAKHTAALVE